MTVSSLSLSEVKDLYSSLGSVFACLMSAELTVCVSLLAIFIKNHVTRMTFDQGRDVAPRDGGNAPHSRRGYTGAKYGRAFRSSEGSEIY